MIKKTVPAKEPKTETTIGQTAETPDVPKKSNRKKYVIIVAMIVILIAVITGFSIYNTPANRLSRQLDLGNRYLEELNYEMAVVAFDQAIAIDPMSVDAYLGKAEAYIALDDLQAAVETLQAGYDLTGNEKLIGMLDKFYLELPFDIADITIQGYDLLEPHFEEVIKAFGCPMEEAIDTEYGWMYVDHSYSSNHFSWVFNDGGGFSYETFPGENGRVDLWISPPKNDISLYIKESHCDLPVYAGSYEEWCTNLGIDIFKNTMKGIQKKEIDGKIGTVYADGSMLAKSNNNYYRILYGETLMSNGRLYCDFYMDNCDGEIDFWICAIFSDTVDDVISVGYMVTDGRRYPDVIGEFLH